MMAQDYDTLNCNKVLESSVLYTALKDEVEISRTLNNVCINFGDDFEAYNKSLSKSTRQNLRTAYNRLNTDGKSLEFKVMVGGGGVNLITLRSLTFIAKDMPQGMVSRQAA